MDYLVMQNRANAGEIEPARVISARDKIVAVIGGGDTGSDCVGTASRQGAKEIHQLEILPEPPSDRTADNPWPEWPRILRTSTSHEEGCMRRWCVTTKKLTGKNGEVTHLHGAEVEWQADGPRYKMRELPGTEFVMPVDLVLLAMGFVHVEHSDLVEKMGLSLDKKGNIITDDNFETSISGVFAAGDAASGASLVVRAIDAGRKAADAIDRKLK
jgi:NADPH-dependent glutamate synthase beta subunit-like oxidoreductase